MSEVVSSVSSANAETQVAAEYDWAHDPHWLAFADHMAAALNMLWEHEQKLAQPQADTPTDAQMAQFEQAKREAAETGAKRVALVVKDMNRVRDGA